MKKINIASFDGGGIKGVSEISQLVEIEKHFRVKAQDVFQFFTGTSTGAIIAALLTLGYSAQEILELYVKHGPKIFDKPFWRLGLFRAKYSDEYLNTVLAAYINPDTDFLTLKNQNRQALLMPAYNTKREDIICFSTFHTVFDDWKIIDVVRASASAQSYFKPHLIKGDYYIDGGNVINNPALQAYDDACDFMKAEEVNLMSFSSGVIEKGLPNSQTRWGLIKWAKTTIETNLREQAQQVDKELKEIYSEVPDKGVYLRLETKLKYASDSIDLATPENIRNLILDGRNSVNTNFPAVADFLKKAL